MFVLSIFSFVAADAEASAGVLIMKGSLGLGDHGFGDLFGMAGATGLIGTRGRHLRPGFMMAD